jgi:hypothetical protein
MNRRRREFEYFGKDAREYFGAKGFATSAVFAASAAAMPVDLRGEKRRRLASRRLVPPLR